MRALAYELAVAVAAASVTVVFGLTDRLSGVLQWAVVGGAGSVAVIAACFAGRRVKEHPELKTHVASRISASGRVLVQGVRIRRTGSEGDVRVGTDIQSGAGVEIRDIDIGSGEPEGPPSSDKPRVP
jgi:hypothetical protein